MEKIGKGSWTVLFVSDQLQQQNDVGVWLGEIIINLTEQQGCTATFSTNYNDAHDIVYSREDLGAIVLDFDMDNIGVMHKKNMAFMEKALKTLPEQSPYAAVFIDYIRKRNTNIPILILTARKSIEDIPDEVLQKINGVMWKLTDTPQFNAGRIERSVIEYSESVLPPFFKNLVAYVNEYKFAWHTPGHMGGQGFLKSPSGTALHKFFGENVLRADLSISVPELGSLLDHSGLTGMAEIFSAKVFGSDRTYYVLNGTSTANQIIWRSQVAPGDHCLLDRNCHKSLNHSMIITSARPEYMIPIRNALGIIGPVDFKTVSRNKEYTMSVITNSTYDGICYKADYVKNQLKGAKIIHFDEAWYAYAKFHPIYEGYFGMSLKDRDKLVFSSQSTHKLLTAFSQASMIHVKFPKDIQESLEYQQEFHDLFNESYMMHGSTSPQYSMVASLEVATKMMHDNGKTAYTDIMEEAIELRKKIAQIKKVEMAKGNWFFGIWQPEDIINKLNEELINDQSHWILKPGAEWHGFNKTGLSEEYTMLDPIKLTFLCPGMDACGTWHKDGGIPAAIVTNYLIDKGIVCEKTDYYSWLLLNSLGTTKGKQGTLVAELYKFRDLYNSNAPLEEVLPQLVNQFPKRYSCEGLKDHCQSMHNYIIEKELLSKMIKSYQMIPDQKLIPSEAYRHIVSKKVKFIELNKIDIQNDPKIAGVMLVPYPPGIPIMMGGEEFNLKSQPILEYLIARQNFENEFPGYEGDIHGIDRSDPDKDGKKYFKTLVVDQRN